MKFTCILMVVSLSTLIRCESDTSSTDQNPAVPEVEVSATDPALMRLDGSVRYNQTMFSGFVVEYDHQDQVISKKGYFNGKRHGLHTMYYPNGTIKESRMYKHGEKHGLHQGYHPNGFPSFLYRFNEGFSEGNHKEWFENGSLYADMNYVKGKEFGTQRVWREDGKLRANYVVRENGRRYGLQGIKRCTKLDAHTKTIDPYENN